MTLLTSQTDMATREREIGLVMIEGDILPTDGLMAGGAVCAIFAAVLIVLLVAGIAVGWRADKNLIDVTRLTGCFRMLALQLERRQVVVELRRGPAFHQMAILTNRTQASLVRLHPGVTGITILAGHREVSQFTGIEMTLVTGQLDVPSLQLEGETTVIEWMAKTVQAVVAVEADSAICQGVGGHERRVDLTVAGVAAVQVEGIDFFRMAVLAGERVAFP